MDTRQEIYRRYFREYDSIRKIARDLQINRTTVKRHLLAYYRAKKESDNSNDANSLQEFLSKPPTYNTQHRFRRKLSPEIEDIINSQLKENQRKRQEGLRKQIKRKIDIHEFILKQGYQIGYTTVCNYIREKELRRMEAYIRQEYLPGEECEFDWAEIKLNISGARRRLYLAVFTSAYSNYRYGRLFSRQDTLAFMEAHNVFFSHLQGVHQEMVYDNMRVAIRDFAGRSEKAPTEALLNLSGWFHFRWRFCNVRRGNEKGHVERSVEFVRRKAFSDKDTFDSLESAQQHLTMICNGLNEQPGTTGKVPTEELSKEQPSLWKYPGAFECFLTEQLKVDKYATICIGTNHYSVPDNLVSKMVKVKIYTDELRIYDAHNLVSKHERCYGKFQWIISLDHYLMTLSRKPGALHGSVALTQAPEAVRKVYSSWFTKQPHDFIDLLQFCRNNQVPHQRLLETADYVNEICPGHVTAEQIMALLGNRSDKTDNPEVMGKPGEIEQFSDRQLNEITRLMTQNIQEAI